MDDRQARLLTEIINEYVKTASPVGSKLLAGRSCLGVSPATIRNEMAELENQGYIVQPHTSAGRVPTIKAYRHFVAGLNTGGHLQPNIRKSLEELLANLLKQKDEEAAKILAKKTAELAGNAVIVAFSANDIYYTGFSYLLAQPEFKEQESLIDLGTVIDRLDLAVGQVFDQVKEVAVMLGHDNPFGHDCAAVFGKCSLNNNDSLLGILGPVRMDYEKALGLIDFLRQETPKLNYRL